MISDIAKARIVEAITGRNNKRFAASSYVFSRVCRFIGRPLGARELNLIDSLYYARAMKRCFVQLDFCGRPFCFDILRLSASDVMSLFDRIAAKDCYFFNRIKADSPVVVDIGSHLGVFACYVLKEKPRSVVYAIEPDRDNYELLGKNLGYFDNAKCFQKGMLDKKDTLEFYTSDKIDWRSSFMVNEDFKDKPEFEPSEYVPSYKVEVTDFSSFAAEMKMEKLDMIKITVPGEIEHLVLNGARAAIERFRPQVSISVYEKNAALIESFFKNIRNYSGAPSPYQPSDIRIYSPLQDKELHSG